MTTKGKTHYKKWRAEASDFIGQWDLQRDDGSYIEPIVVIAKVDKYMPRILRQVKQADGTYKTERPKRYAITFQGRDGKPKRKQWLSGPVTQDAIAKLHGQYLEDWIGKKIQLYFDPAVEMAGQRVGGIRVRPFIPGEQPTSDPLDRPVDDEAAERIHEAKGEFDDEDEDTKGAAAQ